MPNGTASTQASAYPSNKWEWLTSFFTNKDEKRIEQRKKVTSAASKALKLAANGDASTEAFQELRTNLKEANKDS